MEIENMSESSNSEFQPEEGGLRSFRSEAIPEQVPQGGLRGLINRARQKFTRGHSNPPPESTPHPDPTDLLDQTRIQNYDGEELRAALRQRGETERASSFSERLRKSWEGLISSAPEKIKHSQDLRNLSENDEALSVSPLCLRAALNSSPS